MISISTDGQGLQWHEGQDLSDQAHREPLGSVQRSSVVMKSVMKTGARASPTMGSPGLFVNSLAEAAPQLLDLFAYTGDSAGYPTTIKRRNTQHADLLALFVHHEGQGYKVNTAKRDIGKER